MITASPTEFIPRGRQAVEEHPGPLIIKRQQAAPVESMLLSRMQNFNLNTDNPTEEWIIREGEDDDEDELYFKGHTAIWTQGITDGYEMPCVALTCETQIKYAFFCPPTFIAEKPRDDPQPRCNYGVGILDSKCMKVYFKNGEDYVTAIENPISHVWVTKLGLLLEKDPSMVEVENDSVPMPRLFSLKHPLTEMCPILLKTQTTTGYMVEADYKVIFSAADTDLVLIFDRRISKHFVCRLREASEEEIGRVACQNTTCVDSTAVNPIISFLNSSHRPASAAAAAANKSSYHKSFFNISSPHQLSVGSNFNTSPLQRLQSTLGHSVTSQNFREMEQVAPSRPIVPELCLEVIWMENTATREFNEEASTGFIHTDLVGQNYLCYLLPHSYKLNLAKLEKSHTPDTQVFGMISNITAKRAVNLKTINMICVLAPCGNVMLYSGPNLVGKLHVGGVLAGLTNSSSISSSLSSFPRRSSLLPMSTSGDTRFDDELHLLSPVLPLQQHSVVSIKSGCQELRDEAGRRLNLVYPGKMFRITLPTICDSILVTKCLNALRNVLQKDMAMTLFIKWYSTRNAPGLQNTGSNKEWEIFRQVLSSLIGLTETDLENVTDTATDYNGGPKKRKSDGETGSEADWKFLNATRGKKLNEKSASSKSYRKEASLYSQLRLIHFTLHLVYEEMKLDMTLSENLASLAHFLFELSADFGLKLYMDHYFMDFPALILNKKTVTPGEVLSKFEFYDEMGVPNLFKFINELIKGKQLEDKKYPFIKNINIESKNLIQVMALIFERAGNFVKRIAPPGARSDLYEAEAGKRVAFDAKELNKKILLKLIQIGWTRNSIQNLPTALHFILAQFLENCRLSPPIGCSSEAYKLLLRPELTEHAALVETDSNTLLRHDWETSLSPRIALQPDIMMKHEKKPDEDDGMENTDTKLLRLRFPNDLRVKTVRTFLNSSTAAVIDIVQLPSVSDHEFIEEQEKQLFAICIRTMSLPVGRGMFTIRTIAPSCTESLLIPKLCLSGKEIHRGATVELQQIEVPANMTVWPQFHNGVAAGLKVTADSLDVDSTWIVYNKPKPTTDQSSEHAGFLMGLGLNGHLKSLSFMSIYEYLVKCDEMTSVGLLIGISAAYRGTQDMKTTKLLSVHIEALLPPTAVELDIPQNVQIASLMGIGLVYQGTAKRHISEVLLQEIGRPPGPEMENHVDRESYALSAGLALGLVTLGLGETSSSLRDLNVSDTLHYYMIGGNKRPLTGSQKEKYKLSSFQIREGTTVNIDVTAPGATLALGLMFFRSNNQAVANWMKPPDTRYLLDFVRSDLLLLRIISRGLIMWDKIEPTTEWVYSNVPSSLAQIIKERPDPDDTSIEIDHESNCQAYCNIITGAAFCIGLRYAGTNDEKAFNTLKKVIDFFLNINSQWQYISEFAGKATIESCAVLALISVSLVCAGSGNLNVLKIIRMMRSRIGTSHSQVTYGSHMGIHMALGFLFLGAGRFTISRTPEAIAALIISIFPKFPNHSSDNRYHLQAFRHLYVLAIEPRLFLPRDIDSGKLVLCNLYCVDIGSTTPRMLDKAPCMLPELDSIEAVYVDDSSYWFVYFDRHHNWNQLIKILQSNGCIDIKQKTGCFSHLEDPKKLKTLLAETLTTEQYKTWQTSAQNLMAFFNTQSTFNLASKIGFPSEANPMDDVDDVVVSVNENETIYHLMLQTYNCLKKDRMHALSIYIGLMGALKKLQIGANPSEFVWQIKMISQILETFKHVNENEFLLSYELLSSLLAKITMDLEAFAERENSVLRQFITEKQVTGVSGETLNKIVVLFIMNEIPLEILPIPQGLSEIQLIMELSSRGISSEGISFLRRVLS